VLGEAIDGTSQEISVSPYEQVRGIFAAFDAKDVPALAALMTDDVRLRLGNAATLEGKSAFVEAVQNFVGSVARFRHDVINVWSDGDALIAELEVHYTRLDGGEITLPCCNVFRLRDGSVADYRVYIDINPVYA
jgi:ketosteroid isomerase-like protein